jgi:hypothetical protein
VLCKKSRFDQKKLYLVDDTLLLLPELEAQSHRNTNAFSLLYPLIDGTMPFLALSCTTTPERH